MTKKKLYREFLEHGIIKILNEDDIKKALNNVDGRNAQEGMALLITLYYTGCRPVEALNIKSHDITRNNNYIIIQMPYSKRGKTRPFYLKYSLPLVKELYKFAVSRPPEMFLFYNFRGDYVREVINRKGEKKEIKEISYKLRYYFKKWFKGILEDDINPYYLRHNRWSKASLAGMSDREIKQLKGSGSIEYYTHLSAKTAKELAKKID